jgi:hypothetical protein
MNLSGLKAVLLQNIMSIFVISFYVQFYYFLRIFNTDFDFFGKIISISFHRSFQIVWPGPLKLDLDPDPVKKNHVRLVQLSAWIRNTLL